MRKIRAQGFWMCLCLLLSIAVSQCSRGPDARVVEVVRGPFHIKVRAVGRMESAAGSFILCPSVYRIWSYTISYQVPEGTPVKAGDVVLRFDTRELSERTGLKKAELRTAVKELERTRLVERETLDQLKLNLAEARMNLGKAGRKAGEPADLFALNEVKKNQMDLELAQLNAKLAQARVDNQRKGQRTRIRMLENKIKNLENQVSLLEEGIEKMAIKAPKEGMIFYAVDWQGRKRVVGDRVWVGVKLLEMPDLNRMQVAAAIPEPQAGKVAVGLKVEVRLDSNPERVFYGRVKSLGRIFRAKSDEQPAVVFDAVISVDEPDPEIMRPGMTATVEIIVSSRQEVLQMPEKALLYRENGVFAAKKTAVGRRLAAVTVGARSGDTVEILSGLKEGDRVLLLDRENGGEQ